MVEPLGDARVLGLPEDVTACLFDLDGVLTDTAALHAAAWRDMFDGFLRQRAARDRAAFVAFDPVGDYDTYVDGKPREDGVRCFLRSRGCKERHCRSLITAKRSPSRRTDRSAARSRASRPAKPQRNPQAAAGTPWFSAVASRRMPARDPRSAGAGLRQRFLSGSRGRRSWRKQLCPETAISSRAWRAAQPRPVG